MRPNKFILALASLVLLVSAAGQDAASEAMERLGPEFRRTTTRHFVIVSDCDPEWTRANAEMMEAAHHQFQRVMRRLGVPVTEPEGKLLAIFVRDQSRFAAFARSSDGFQTDWAGGYYSAENNRVVLFDDATSPAFTSARRRIDEYARTAAERREQARGASPDEAAALIASAEELETWVKQSTRELEALIARSGRAKAVHETVHMLAFNCGLQSRYKAAPFWFTEGLAASFEADSTAGAFGPDHETPWRRERFEAAQREGRLIPLREFVGMTTVTDPSSAEAMYAEAYALFTHLFRYQREELAAFSQALLTLPASEATTEGFTALFERHFGAAEKVERRLVR